MMWSHKCIFGLAVVVIFVGVFECRGQAAPQEVDPGDKYYQAQKWEEAARVYSALTSSDPSNARAWYRYGVSLQRQGKHKDAASAYEKAIDNGQGKPIAVYAMYNLAACYARLGEAAKSLAWLSRTVAANPIIASTFRSDTDFALLQSEPQFKELAATVEKIEKPCMFSEGYRQFDFWLGEWDVFVGGQRVGYNNVKSLQGGCIVEENWEGGLGENGQSFNFYNPVTKKWHQSYMSNRAGNWMMDGEYKDGALRFEGHIYSPKGDVLVRMTFFNLEPGKVRQTAETSSDGGKTWTNIWDAMYLPKKREGAQQ
jgi:tetratricopeptide (TPR) repeat protein